MARSRSEASRRRATGPPAPAAPESSAAERSPAHEAGTTKCPVVVAIRFPRADAIPVDHKTGVSVPGARQINFTAGKYRRTSDAVSSLDASTTITSARTLAQLAVTEPRQSRIDRSEATDPTTTVRSTGMLFRGACVTKKKSRVWRRLFFSAQCAV